METFLLANNKKSEFRTCTCIATGSSEILCVDVVLPVALTQFTVCIMVS